mgnify:FL=1
MIYISVSFLRKVLHTGFKPVTRRFRVYCSIAELMERVAMLLRCTANSSYYLPP